MGHMHTTLLNSNTNVYKIHDTDKNIRGEWLYPSIPKLSHHAKNILLNPPSYPYTHTLVTQI